MRILRESTAERRADLDNAVMQYLCLYWQQHGRSPSYRELVRGAGLPSTQSVQGILERLQSKGLARWTPGQARSIVPVRY